MDMDKDNDMLVQLIREEMVNAEKNLLDWNAFWREVYVNADVPYSFFNEFCGLEQDVKKHLEHMELIGLRFLLVKVDKSL